MSLQEKIIFQYKQSYPHDTLKEISHRTNIQITRVFRLLNGKKMKLEEYEQFYQAIAEKDRTTKKTDVTKKIFQEALSILSHSEIEDFCDYLSRRLFIKKIQPEKINYANYLNFN